MYSLCKNIFIYTIDKLKYLQTLFKQLMTVIILQTKLKSFLPYIQGDRYSGTPKLESISGKKTWIRVIRQNRISTVGFCHTRITTNPKVWNEKLPPSKIWSSHLYLLFFRKFEAPTYIINPPGFLPLHSNHFQASELF